MRNRHFVCRDVGLEIFIFLHGWVANLAELETAEKKAPLRFDLALSIV